MNRKDANRRRGFRILMWVAGLFFLAQLSGGLVLDYWWARPRYPWLVDMYAALDARARTPEIIFLGSSRFQLDIDCGVLDAALRRDLGSAAPRTFNAAIPGAEPTLFDRAVEHWLSQGKRPKLLVVEISPENVARRDNWIHQQALRLLDWTDVPEALPSLVRNGKILYLVRGRLIPLCTHRYEICKEGLGLLAGLFGPNKTTPKADPDVPPPVDIDPEPPPMTPEAWAKIESFHDFIERQLSSYRVGGMAARRLERMLDQCRKADVPVLLVGVPVSSLHRRSYTPEVETAFLAYVQRLMEQYGCRYADWRDRIPDNYFADHHHVYPQGGVYFSRRLAPAVLVPAWRELQRYGLLARFTPNPSLASH